MRRIHYYYLAWIAIPLVILSTSLFAIHNHLYSETYSYSLQLVSSEGYTDGFLAYMPLTGTLQVSLVCQGGGDIKVNVSVVAETRTSLHLSCNNTVTVKVEKPGLVMVYARVEEVKGGGVEAWLRAQVKP
ncbi:MAG: hypothetical protein QW348_07625 [Ignisphaera sp.]|uniref:hypothetical protein n=1 Tax=Thermofilum sp. TaxID=1961369 RepID=UPI00316498ED